jgi:hypothetical protein
VLLVGGLFAADIKEEWMFSGNVSG